MPKLYWYKVKEIPGGWTLWTRTSRTKFGPMRAMPPFFRPQEEAQAKAEELESIMEQGG